VTCTLFTIRSTLCCSILMVNPAGSQGMPHVVVAPVRWRVVSGEEESDVGHVAIDAELAQPA
jgi:hypothetical protein